MTKTSATMELRRLLELNGSTRLPLALDTEDMIVFLPDEEAHCDHVFWRGVEASNGNWTVEQCVDPAQGTCCVRRVWLTPQERQLKERAAQGQLSPPLPP